MNTSHGHHIPGTVLEPVHPGVPVHRCGGVQRCPQCQEEARMGSTQKPFGDRAREVVFEYIKGRLEKTDTHVRFALDEVYMVWGAKTLQNWKALVSTTLPDGMYYEVTFNGDKNEIYLDAYKKFDNITVPALSN